MLESKSVVQDIGRVHERPAEKCNPAILGTTYVEK